MMLIVIGYVLDCFPSFCEEWEDIRSQMEFVKKLSMGPTVIVHLKVCVQFYEC